MQNNLDNQYVRASQTCPVCSKTKPVDQLVCWPCYRTHGMKNGNPYMEMQIERANDLMEMEAEAMT